MEINTIHLLVSFDKNYIGPFQVLLQSLVASNPQEMYYRLLASLLLPDTLERIL